MSDQERAAKRLVRRTDSKVIAGVCSGLSDYFGFDPLVFRIGFVLLTFAGAAGPVIYVLAWALIPAHDAPPGSSAGRGRVLLTWIGIGLLFLVGISILPLLFGVLISGPGALLDFASQPGPLAIAAGLIVIGALLLRDPPEAGSPIEPARGDSASAALSENAAPQYVSSPDTRELPAKSPRRERSPLTAFTVAATFIVVAIAALLSNSDTIDLDVGQLSALGLVTLGLGLLVATWFGRGRLLIAVGILLLPVVLVSSLVDFPLTGQLGSYYFAPRSSEDLDLIEVLAGDVMVDLSDFEFGAEPEEVFVKMGIGQVNVTVPRGVYVETHVAARAGEVFVFDRDQSSYDLSFTDVQGDAGADRRLTLNINGGLLSLNIYRSYEDGGSDRSGGRRRERELDGRRGEREADEPRNRRAERAERKKDR